MPADPQKIAETAPDVMQIVSGSGGVMGVVALGYTWLKERFKSEDLEQAAMKERIVALEKMAETFEVQLKGHDVELRVLKNIDKNIRDMRSALMVIASAAERQTKDAVNGILSGSENG